MTRPGAAGVRRNAPDARFFQAKRSAPGALVPRGLRRNPIKTPSFDRLSRAFARTSPHLRCADARPAGYISDAGDAPGDAETEAKRGGSKACQKGRKKVAKGWEIAVNLSLFVRICRILRKFPRGFLRPGGNPPQKRPRPENSPAAPVGAIPKRKRERRNEEERRPQAASAENPVPDLRQNHGLSRRGVLSPPLFPMRTPRKTGGSRTAPTKRQPRGTVPAINGKRWTGRKNASPTEPAFREASAPSSLSQARRKCRASGVLFSNKSYN